MSDQPEGARYCYLNILPFVSGYEDTLIECALDAFNEFVLDKRRHAYILAYCINLVIDSKEVTIDEIMKARYFSIKTGKYSPDSYRKYIPVEQLEDAAARHAWKALALNEKEDEESGCNHWAHFINNLLIIIEQLRNKPQPEPENVDERT
jgi:hypothetical protein